MNVKSTSSQFWVLFLLGTSTVRHAQAADFCRAWDPAFLGDVTEPTAGTAGLDGDLIAAQMGPSLLESASLLGVVPGLGVIGAIAGMAADMYQDQNAAEQTAALVDYVDAVNTANKISDLETDWDTSVNNLVAAMESIDGDSDSPDDTKLISAATICHDFFGYSGTGETWGGKLGETSIDYSVFGAIQRLLYAPSMCNQCLALHSTRYITYNNEYESKADSLGKPGTSSIIAKRDAAIEDLRYTAGRCLVDVLPMAMDAALEQGDSAEDYETKTIPFVGERWYAVNSYNGARWFEYDQGNGVEDERVQFYFDKCRKNMYKNIGDWWMEWYRERLFTFQRDWAYLSAFASPNGLVIVDPPTATFDLDRTYTIMNEAYGAFLNPVPYYSLNEEDNWSTTRPEDSEDPLDHKAIITNQKESYIYDDSTSGNYYLKEQSLPLISGGTAEGYAIADKETDQVLCLLNGLAYFQNDTATTHESWCVWQFENVEADSSTTMLGDSSYDATTVYIKNVDGKYLTADTTFLTLYNPFGIAVEGSDSKSEYATWRILHTPNFETANYGEVFECYDSSDCDATQICDPAAHFCTAPPDLPVGEKCELDEECLSGVCQSLDYSIDRCAETSNVGSILTICESDDYSDGTKCDVGLTCSMETPSYGLCKLPDNAVNCYGDNEKCASGFCNSFLSVSACDTVEPLSYGALCESDDHCENVLVCGSDGLCGYGGEQLVLSQVSRKPEEHEAIAQACGGNLASITDEDTNIAVKALMVKYGVTGDRPYIGLKKFQNANTWTWRDGSDYSYSTFAYLGNYRSSTSWNAYVSCNDDDGEELEYCEWLASQANLWPQIAIYRLPEGYEQIAGCSTVGLSV